MGNAHYHLSAKVFSRGKGESSVAKAAYRAGENLYDLRTGERFDYSNRKGVVETRILAPEDALDWVQQREVLWNRIEAATNYKTGQVAREIEVGLSRLLDHEANMTLVCEFVQNEFVSKGMIADISIHSEIASDGKENKHAHIMLTMRKLNGWEFHKKKAVEWDQEFADFKNAEGSKHGRVTNASGLQRLRASWAEHLNRALAENGSTARAEHRSYAERGINKIAEPKLGAAIRLQHTNENAAKRVEYWHQVRTWNRAQSLQRNAQRLTAGRGGINTQAQCRRVRNHEWLEEWMHGDIPSPHIIAYEAQPQPPPHHDLPEPDR